MDATINYLSANNVALQGLDGVKSDNSTLGVKVGMLWLDIEGTQYWGSSTSANTDFIVAMANQGKARGVSLGVYTSKSQWTPITGSSTRLSAYPLWYAHYDNVQSFSDFSAFGGWSKPAIKQYAGKFCVCARFCCLCGCEGNDLNVPDNLRITQRNKIFTLFIEHLSYT